MGHPNGSNCFVIDWKNATVENGLGKQIEIRPHNRKFYEKEVVQFWNVDVPIEDDKGVSVYDSPKIGQRGPKTARNALDDDSFYSLEYVANGERLMNTKSWSFFVSSAVAVLLTVFVVLVMMIAKIKWRAILDRRRYYEALR